MKKKKCSQCNKSFDELSDLRTHFKMEHTAEARELQQQMRRFDEDHSIDLKDVCQFCTHRGSHGH